MEEVKLAGELNAGDTGYKTTIRAIRKYRYSGEDREKVDVYINATIVRHQIVAGQELRTEIYAIKNKEQYYAWHYLVPTSEVEVVRGDY